MHNTLPSSVVDYIDSRFPEAKKEQENPGDSYSVHHEHYHFAMTLLTMVESIPEHLITLKGFAFAEYHEAVVEIRAIVSFWSTGSTKRFIVHTQDSRGLNPITILREHLEALHDEGVEASTNELLFIQDEDLRELLRIDLSSVNQAIDNCEWKAATVIGGSVIEAFLLCKLVELKSENPSAINDMVDSLLESKKLQKRPPSDLNEWNLHPLTETAEFAKTIKEVTAKQCRIAKNFRNLIHPGATVRQSQECNRGTAFAVAAAIAFVIEDLTKGAL
jgi:hypothetical protein